MTIFEASGLIGLVLLAGLVYFAVNRQSVVDSSATTRSRSARA